MELKQEVFSTDQLVKIGNAPKCHCGSLMAPVSSKKNEEWEFSGKFRCLVCPEEVVLH